MSAVFSELFCFCEKDSVKGVESGLFPLESDYFIESFRCSPCVTFLNTLTLLEFISARID